MPRPHERRIEGGYPYYKLALWSDKSLCWHDLRKVYPSEREARAAAEAFGPGRYRISEVDEDGRCDRLPFTVE